MDWIPALVKAIGFVRLILIFSGILMLSRCILKTRALLEYQKQCFAISGVIYLLGLTPQSLLLLISNSDAENYLLDSGYLCWIQKFACIVAVSIHALLFLGWMYTVIRQYHKLHNKNVNALFERREIFHLLVIYVLLLVSSRVFFLNLDDSKKTYMDVASRTDNASLIGWTVLPVQNPAQVIRLQLLLCENSLSATDMKYFLIVCYVLLLVPLALLFFIFKPSFSDEHSTSEASVICHPDLVQGWQHHAWWEQDVNIQKILSASVTFWYFAIQPAVFALQRQHFIDFGTHLLLTICVFVPWAFPSTEQKSIQSWV